MSVAAQPSQAPRVGRLQRWLGPLYFTGVFWYRLCHRGAQLLPEFLVPLVLRAFAFLFFVALGGVRRAIARNLETVLGPATGLASWRRAWRTIHVYAWCFFERYEAFVPTKSFDASVEKPERWDALEGGSTGAILLTAHIGMWEVASRLPSSNSDRELHLVREEELDENAQRYYRDIVSAHAGARYVTHFAARDASLGARLLVALRRGAFVALQGDRPRRGGKAHPARVFGRTLELPLGPAALARSAGVPLVPVFVYRLGRRRYSIAFSEPIHVEKTRDRDGDVARAMDAVAGEIEAAIRRDPNQWFCFADAFGPA